MTKEEEERLAREEREAEERKADEDRAARDRADDEEREDDERRARDRRDADRRKEEERQTEASRESDDQADDQAEGLEHKKGQTDPLKAAADPAAAKGQGQKAEHLSQSELDRNAGTYVGGGWIPSDAVRRERDAERDAQSAGREKGGAVQVSEAKRSPSQEWAANGLEKEKQEASTAPAKQQEQEEERKRRLSM